MEQRLAALHYDVGTPDGHFGPADTYAVTAFQKVHGLPRTGRATDDVVALMAADHDPAPLVPAGGAMRVEVDIPRQVLFLYEHDALVRILPVSTGSGQRYCVEGECAVAVTPGGSYRVFRKKLGQDVSKLGVLYNPLYFNGGIAIHGEPADPSYPASHGCVRIPMAASLWFYNEVPDGTPVYVIGGPNAPVPFGAQAPPETTTTAPATSVPRTTTPPTTTPPTTTPATTTTTSSSTTSVPRTTVPTTSVPPSTTPPK
jgi:peptidoglycan hydrolase-like protein with peptidoglycan-binding domain